MKIQYIILCAFSVLLLSCTGKEEITQHSNSFFNFTTPSKALKLDKELRNYYMWGFEVGRKEVFKHVSVDMLKERIKEQKKNKSASFDYGFFSFVCGAIDNGTREQNLVWSNGYSDGIESANKLIGEAINKHYDDPSIIDDYKKLKKKIKEETSNKINSTDASPRR